MRMEKLLVLGLAIGLGFSGTAFAQDDAWEETTSTSEEATSTADETTSTSEETTTQEDTTESAKATGDAAEDATATSKGDKEKQADEFPLKKLTLTANPLSWIILRFSMNVEYMLVKHHGLILVPSFEGSSTDDSSSTYFGAEAGYHFYSGQRGANGFFIGPSLVYMYENSTLTQSRTTTQLFALALDIGGQHVARNGFTIGSGMGFMYFLSGSEKRTAKGSEPKVKRTGTLPRILFTIGYSF